MPFGRTTNGNDLDALLDRLLPAAGRPATWPAGGYDVPMDVFMKPNQAVVRLELAGVRPDDVEVTVEKNNIVVNGKRDLDTGSDEVRFVHRGTFYGQFTKRIALGEGLALDKISARFDNGILELAVPLAEDVKPKRISIDVGRQSSIGAGSELAG